MREQRSINWQLLIASLFIFVLVACGSPEVVEPTEVVAVATDTPLPPPPPPTNTPEPPPTNTPLPEPTATPSNAVTNLQDVERAVIQIEAEGTFVDPAEGIQLNAAGAGSGFIIDESGIAVTNNHVVTGAAILRVHISGEDRPRNARVLGVSECSDLAVIDIDGDDFPYLEWYGEEINVGLEVYAAGFPLGDPRFTLTRGIVSKERADGESSWASVDYVLEHDATINPGNSGGPLVTADGKVVGVNYASLASANQYFAIARNQARPVINQLREGNDVESIGINAVALDDGEGGSYGIWVYSVESGSPADTTGIKAGDILIGLEGLDLTQRADMANYCDVLRSHRMSDTLSVEVLRLDTEHVLEGQINGRELEVTTDFSTEFEDDVADDPNNETYEDYTVVVDDSGTLEVEIPSAWSEVDGRLPAEDSIFDANILASTDLEAFQGWSVPGVDFSVSMTALNDYDEGTLLDALDFSDECTYDHREPYEDPLYTGFFDLWVDCGGVGTVLLVVSAVPETRDYIALVLIQVVSDADLDALERILDSFFVVE